MSLARPLTGPRASLCNSCSDSERTLGAGAPARRPYSNVTATPLDVFERPPVSRYQYWKIAVGCILRERSRPGEDSQGVDERMA